MRDCLKICFGLLWVGLLSFPFGALGQNKAEELVEKGDQQLKRNPPDYSSALYFFLEAEKTKHDDNALLLKIGICYLNTDSISAGKAVPYLKRCYDYSPNLEADLEFLLARAYEYNGDYKLALSKYREYKNSLSSAQLKQKKISAWSYSVFKTTRQPYSAEKTTLYDLGAIVDERIAACSNAKPKTAKEALPIVSQDLGPSGAVTLVVGTVSDEEGKPIKAQIKVWEVSSSSLFGEFNSNSKTGKYLLNLPVGKAYHIEFTAENLLPFWALVDRPEQAEFAKWSRNISLSSKKACFQTIRFEFFKERISAGSNFGLEKLNQFVKSKTGKKFNVVVHTSSVGSEETKQKLSLGRATEVANWLIKLGLDAQKIKSEGKGSRSPLMPETDEEGNQDLDAGRFNERVELEVY